jgi:trk system potassium uptake protein TrkH
MFGLDTTARDILPWRSLLEWFGGMKLFRTESSDGSDKSMPRSQQLLKLMLLVHVILTLLYRLLAWTPSTP